VQSEGLSQPKIQATPSKIKPNTACSTKCATVYPYYVCSENILGSNILVQAQKNIDSINDVVLRSCVMSLAWKFQQIGYVLHNLNTVAGYK
jgi:hypothetical protein